MSDLLRSIALMLGKDLRTIRRWCARGYIPGAYRTKGGHWRIRARYPMILVRKIRAITRGKTRRRQQWKNSPFGKIGLGRLPHLVPPTPREYKEWMEKRDAIADAFVLEMAWRGENWRAEDPIDCSPTWHEWYELQFGRLPGGEAAFLQRTVRPEALKITKLSSIHRRLVILIMGRWKAEERITATWLASELDMPRRDFYRHPVTKRWKSMVRELICNAAAHDKLLGRQCGHGFRKEVCLPPSDEERDARLEWEER
jgi:hypothetical protein